MRDEAVNPWEEALEQARWGDLGEGLQRHLWTGGDPDLRSALARNPHLAPRVQALVLTGGSEHERGELARNPGATPEVLDALTRDAHSHVRSWLAVRPGTSAQVQLVLARDKDDVVRMALARKARLHPQALEVLARDEDVRVLRCLAGNPGVVLGPSTLVRVLVQFPEGEALIEASLAGLGPGQEEAAVLLEGWTGTLEELLSSAGELSRG